MIVLLVAAGTIGFFALLGARIKGAMQEQQTISKEREAAAQRAATSAKEPPKAAVARPRKATWQASVPVEGTLGPWHEADLGFKASGRLASVRVKVGDHVKTGAPLASLEATEASASQRAAQAQLKVAQAQLALVQDTEKRTTEMVGAGAVGEATGVQAKGQLNLVMAQVEGAKAQLALTGANIANHTLTAPFAGVVSRAPTGPGAVIGAGMPLIHLQDISKLRLSATVSEADAPLIKVGAVIDVPQGKKLVKGKVLAVLPSVDASTRRVPLEAEVPNDASDPLLAGVFVRAVISGNEVLPVLRLPATARRPGSQDEVLVVVDGKLVVRRVSFVLAPDGALLIRDGLSEADEVLTTPSAEAREGDQVTAVREGTP